MADVQVIDATPALCGRLMAYTLDEDKEDMMRGWGVQLDEGILLSFKLCGESKMIMCDGIPVGMFGCMKDGYLWMMRGEGISKVAIRFIRQAQVYFDQWLSMYGYLCTDFWGGNKRLRRFMEWSGFKVTETDNGYVRCEKWAYPQG